MTNPFFETWDTPFGVPPFDAIETGHFAPAYKEALAQHAGEIAQIAGNSEAPGFDNTIAALELAGRPLRRVDMVFSQLAGANTNAELQAVERDMAPVVTRHWNEIFLNAALFARIDQLHRHRNSLGLDAEQLRVLERYHLDFVRAGAQLSDAERARFGEIVERLATLATEYAQNVLGDEQDTVFALTEAETDGLPCRGRCGDRHRRQIAECEVGRVREVQVQRRAARIQLCGNRPGYCGHGLRM